MLHGSFSCSPPLIAQILYLCLNPSMRYVSDHFKEIKSIIKHWILFSHGLDSSVVNNPSDGPIFLKTLNYLYGKSRESNHTSNSR